MHHRMEKKDDKRARSSGLGVLEFSISCIILINAKDSLLEWLRVMSNFAVFFFFLLVIIDSGDSPAGESYLYSSFISLKQWSLGSLTLRHRALRLVAQWCWIGSTGTMTSRYRKKFLYQCDREASALWGRKKTCLFFSLSLSLSLLWDQ